MEIKKQLKIFDVKLSKLAKELEISRPTLDYYIESYEKGMTLPNDDYQKIFEYLFATEIKSSIEFAKKYDYVKRTMLNNVKKDIEDSKKDNRESYLIDKIVCDVNSYNLDDYMLEFINLFISNSNLALVKAIYMYFNYVNGFANLNENEISNKDKALFANLFKLFISYNDDSISYDDSLYNQFYEKSLRMFEKKKIKTDADEIINYIKENISDNSNIDFEYLRKMINSKEEI